MKKTSLLLLAVLLLTAAAARPAQGREMRRVRIQIGLGIGSAVNGETSDGAAAAPYSTFYTFFPSGRAAFEIGFCPALAATLLIRYRLHSTGTEFEDAGSFEFQYSSFSTAVITLGGRFRLPFDLDFDDWFETEYPKAIGDFVPYLRYAYGVSLLLDTWDRTIRTTGDFEQRYADSGQLLLTLEAAFGVEITLDPDIRLFFELTYLLMMAPEVVDSIPEEADAMGSASVAFGFMFAF